MEKYFYSIQRLCHLHNFPPWLLHFITPEAFMLILLKFVWGLYCFCLSPKTSEVLAPLPVCLAEGSSSTLG